jgi:hypothetical protein
MVKVIHVDDHGVEVAAIELDDFDVELLYAGIAARLKEAATAPVSPSARLDLSKEARERRSRILKRVNA